MSKTKNDDFPAIEFSETLEELTKSKFCERPIEDSRLIV